MNEQKEKNLPENETDTYFYIGHNFRIRETRVSDIPIWYKWFNDPAITQEMTHGVVPNTFESQESFRLAYIDGSKNKLIFSIIDINTPELIGTCSINVHGQWLHGHGEISLVIGNKSFQKGPLYIEITSWQLDHAFFMMNMHSVFSSTSEENKAVILTLERMGFSKVGTIRQCAYRKGKYVNGVIHDILKDEWVLKNSVNSC
jgi:[ribosomal protein S5]-alanine N-acetyltransferase